MDDGDKQNKTNNITKKQKDDDVQRLELVPSSFLQSFWIRCRSILPDITDRKFMESELRYVLAGCQPDREFSELNPLV